MSHYEVLSTEKAEAWRKKHNRLPENQQDTYFTPDYYALYEHLGDGKAQCFVFEKNGEIALYPFLINSVNNKGYELADEYFDIQGAYGYNGIISSDHSEAFKTEFFKNLDEYCTQNNIIAEFNRFHPVMDNVSFSEKHRKIIFDRSTVTIDLEQEFEEIKREFSSSTKRALKKAYKNNLKPHVYHAKEMPIQRFKELYRKTMERVNSVPYLFFNDAYFEHLFRLQNLDMITVEYEKKIIASAVCFYSNNFYHYHLGASDEEYLNMRPNNMIFESMIKQGKEKNCKYLHLGGGNSGDENDGLYKFKKGFSKLSTDFYIGKKIHNQEIYESVIHQWKTKNPESFTKFNHRILGYRDV